MALHYNGEVKITKVARMSPMMNNGYLITCPETNEAILIDTPGEPEKLLSAIGNNESRRVHGGELALMENDPKGRNHSDLDETVLELIGPVENLRRDMGQLANDILQKVDEIRLARAELVLKLDKYNHSVELADQEFITRNELERDKLNYQSQLSTVNLAWNYLDLLINYTLEQTQIQYQVGVISKVDVAEAEAGVAEREFGLIVATNLYRNTMGELIDLVLGPNLTADSRIVIEPTDRPEEAISGAWRWTSRTTSTCGWRGWTK